MAARTPVVLIHGLWLHAASWGNWVELFGENGFEPIAPPWPGIPHTVEEARARPEAIAGIGIERVIDHYRAIIAGLGAKPIVIGHSFGGLMAMKLLGLDLAAAAIAMHAAPIKGVVVYQPSAVRSSFPILRNPWNWNRAVTLTPAQFRWSFGSALSAEESADLYARWAIPAPGRPLWEAGIAAFVPGSPADVEKRAGTGPLLLTSGGRDRIVPPSMTRANLRRYRGTSVPIEPMHFPDRGHSLTIDHGWREVAERLISWVRGKGF